MFLFQKQGGWPVRGLGVGGPAVRIHNNLLYTRKLYPVKNFIYI